MISDIRTRLRRGLRGSALVATVGVAVTLAGCDNVTVGNGNGGGGGSDEDLSLSAGSGLDALAGLYDASVDVADVGTDVALVRLDRDGRLSQYDLQSDVVDGGADCHRVTVFDVQETDDGGAALRDADGRAFAQLARVEGGLALTYTDSADLDGDGDTAESLTTVLAPVTDRTESDMNWCTNG